MTILVYDSTTGAIKCSYTFTPDQATPANIQANVPAGHSWVEVADGDSSATYQSAFTVNVSVKQLSQTATTVSTAIGSVTVPASGGVISSSTSTSSSSSSSSSTSSVTSSPSSPTPSS